MSDLNDDITRYHNGSMTPAERHALERRALDDPFLAEALEGIDQIPTDLLEADMSTLHNRLSQRVRPESDRKNVSLWTWPLRIAAGLVLAVSAVSIFFALYVEKGTTDQLALNEEKISPLPEPIAGPLRDTTAALADAALQQDESTAASGIVQESERATKPDVRIAESVDKPEVLKDDDPITADAPAAETFAEEAKEAAEDRIADVRKRKADAEPRVSRSANSFRADSVPEQLATATDERIAKLYKLESPAASKADAPGATQVVKGQVFDVSGTGLPGVNVMIKGTEMGTITNAAGKYELSVPANGQTLVFSFIGYTSLEAEAASGKDVNISLDEDVSQLSEVVVTGYGMEKVEDGLTTPLTFAAPKGGRKAFKQYLESHLHYPEEAIEHQVEGRVTVQFAVEQNGKLTDFRVIRGIGSGCDDEVIRLIKAGPQWSPTRRDTEVMRGVVKVRMKFQLPKKKKK